VSCPTQTQSVEQSVGANVERGWDWTDECARAWLPGTVYLATNCVRPPADFANGFEYLCVKQGQSANQPPPWSKMAIDGGSFRDGSVVWSARPCTAASLYKTISGSVWASDDEEVTLSAQTIFNTLDQQTVAQMSATPAGEFSVTNTVTFTDGTIAIGIYELEVD
jgi:hypothetical protein